MGSIVPVMTSNTAPSPYVASASSYNGAYPPYKAFDGVKLGDVSGCLLNGTSGYVKIYLGTENAVAVNGYQVTTWNYLSSWPGSSPKNWQLLGSNNDVDWDVLDTRTDQINWTDGESRNYNFTNAVVYAYYKLDITANNGSATYTIVQELELYTTVIVKNIKVFRIIHGFILQRLFRVSSGLVPLLLKKITVLCGSYPVQQKILRIVHKQARSILKIFRVFEQESTYRQIIFRVLHQQQDAVLLRVLRVVHGTAIGTAVLRLFRVAHELVSSVYRNDDLAVAITVNGQPVLSWITASLSTDEGRYVWEAQIAVKNQWDGETLLGQYDQVIYHQHGTNYHLIVVDRARGIKVSDNSYEDGWTVQLASPAYRLSSAAASLITQTWPRASSARAIVQELCAAKGITLDWQAPDYIIGELVADKQVPIDIIKTVLNVIGALPQSAPDGTLVVRKETPVMPYDWAIPDISFPALSIISLSEQSDDPQVLYNVIAVMDADDTSDGGGLQHLETDRDDGGKDILAWSEPWALVALRVNSPASETTLSPLGIEIAEYLDNDGEPEWLQFVDGEATSTRPVYQGFQVVNYRGDYPGAISWTPDSKSLIAANGGDYYVQVRYRWRYYRFIYYSNTDYDYQVILTD